MSVLSTQVVCRMDRFITVVDKINDWVGKSVSWLSLLLVLLVCFDVARRFLLNRTDAWIMEVQWHMFGMIFLLGAAYTFKESKHVRVDLFYTDFDPKSKSLVNIVGGLILLIPLCVLLIYVTVGYAYDSYLLGETSPDPGGLPYRFIIKSMIPIAMVLLLLQAIAEVLRSIQNYKAH